MRPAVLAGLALAALPAAAAGQNGPRYATVTDPEVTLRAGPSDKLPDAGTLPAGTRVVVDHEDQGGWLAVVAPPGAVSWVQMLLIDFDPARGLPQRVVAHSEALLVAGRVGLAQPLTEYRKVKVPEGTLLKVIGPGVKHDGKTWYPVEPPFEDYRYLPKTAVRFEGAANTSFTVKDVPPPGLTPIEARLPAAGAGSTPTADGSGPTPRSAAGNAAWARAVEAEQAGRYDEAEKLFFQVAREAADPDLANRCFARIHTLREKKRDGAPAAGGREPSDAAGASGVSRPPAAQDPPGRTAALLPPVRNDRDRGPEPSAPPADRPGWSAAGTLVRSSLALDGRQTYALETAPGVVAGYVVPAPGVDLGRYVRQRVKVYGPSYTRRDLSKPYTVASDVQPDR